MVMAVAGLVGIAFQADPNYAVRRRRLGRLTRRRDDAAGLGPREHTAAAEALPGFESQPQRVP